MHTRTPGVTCMGVVSALALLLTGCAPAPLANDTAKPATISIDARANGMVFRAADATLFITDDKTNAVLASKAGGEFTPWAAIPAVAGQPNALSQIALGASGALLVERFGFGTHGAIVLIGADKSVNVLQGLDPVKRRLGIAMLDDTRALSSWFIKSGDGPATGGVSLIEYSPGSHQASERTLITGLGKPVGIVVQGDTATLSDQTNDMLLKISLRALINHDSGGAATQVIKVTHPDLPALGAAGKVYTPCNKTAVCAISSDGTNTRVADGFHDARGVAFDPDTHRLYVLDRGDTASGMSTLRVITVAP